MARRIRKLEKIEPAPDCMALKDAPDLLAAPPEDRAIVVCLADVAPESTTYVWPGRIPAGKLSILGGDPGEGKSMLMIDAAARISRGRAWPDGSDCARGAVVILTAEDGLGDTVRPRLDAMRGDPARVFVLRAIREGTGERLFDLSRDLAHLEAAIRDSGAILVVIDPLSAYLGEKTETYRDSHVRRVLAPLAALAERTGVAIVAIMHLTKDQARAVLHRAQGNIAFVAAARAFHLVAEDREQPGRRLFLAVKLNIAEKPRGLAFRIIGAGLAARIEWESGSVDIDPDVALARVTADEQTAVASAVEFLRELLAQGPVHGEMVRREAKACGVNERTLWRAKKQLDITTRKQGGLKGPWIWEIPQVQP